MLRPLAHDDADAVLDVMRASFDDLDRRLGNTPEPPGDRAPGLIRIEHLVQTDPGGAWGYERDGALLGAALGIVRDGVWGLSLLAVLPGHQSEGIGGALLKAALAHGNGARGGIILASEDARALRAYHRAGFGLRPAIDARGPVRNRPAAPATVRAGRWPDDAPIVDAASRFVRSATHARDIPPQLGAGAHLLVHDDGGFAIFDDGGRCRLLAAHDDDAAADLLRAVLAAVPDGVKVSVDFITAGQDWAVTVVLEAGVELRPGGAVMARGDIGPLRPYIPSGAYL